MLSSLSTNSIWHQKHLGENTSSQSQFLQSPCGISTDAVVWRVAYIFEEAHVSYAEAHGVTAITHYVITRPLLLQLLLLYSSDEFWKHAEMEGLAEFEGVVTL